MRRVGEVQPLGVVRLSIARTVAALLPALVTAGCDADFVEAVFLYEGSAPVLTADATTFVRVERRSDPRKPGDPITPVLTSPYQQHGGPLPSIPYGDNRVVIIEVRLSSDPA